MIRPTAGWLLLVALLPAPLGAQAPIRFQPGMTISGTGSVRVAPGRYLAPAGDSAAVTIRGHDLTVDLSGVELVGDADRRHPDRYSGVAVRVDRGTNVTVRGARIRGYKVAVLARGTAGLRLLGNDLSDNYRPRLYSGIERESLADWLSYHHNEQDEWLRYGAGIYLADVRGGEIRDNTVQRGMNGLMLTRSSGLRIWNNTFAYNSGLGIGLYRSTRDTIMHNRVDWNVRGYSEGFFNRGQDSAALLMFEQSSDNVVAFNSMTHSGDGLFLWAGQSTMDDGSGGSNDNLFYRNDFSYAPTNGMEATFSRNAFVGNRVEGAWHGLWGGYSWGSVVIGNEFARNVDAIAIEHGQDITIAGNSFRNDTTAIHLWWNRIEPSDWGYPKHRDTRSRDYRITGNHLRGERVGLRIQDTQALTFAGNSEAAVDTLIVAKGDTTGWTTSPASAAANTLVPSRYEVAPLAGGRDVLSDSTIRRDRSAIVVGPWGPFDFRSPFLWPMGRSDQRPLALRVLGPAGRWRVVSRHGVAAVSRTSGAVGDTITVTPAPGRSNDFSLKLEYRGSATVGEFGEAHPAGAPVRFGWSVFRPAATWHLRFIPTDSSARSATPAQLDGLIERPVVATLDTTRMDLMWYRPPDKAVPADSVLTVANATVDLAPGRYVIRTIADDAIRVWVDDTLVLDDWVPGDSHVREVTLPLGGHHDIRAVHLQLDGWYEFRVDVERAE